MAGIGDGATKTLGEVAGERRRRQPLRLSEHSGAEMARRLAAPALEGMAQAGGLAEAEFLGDPVDVGGK
ncbi:hypothetical protein M770_33800 (plasmid) [Pseudomonas aeruginosa VRFPA03]|nr:hypothetical protein M770_33800 [Pseudomonas aeruginosa VRFPA03]